MKSADKLNSVIICTVPVDGCADDRKSSGVAIGSKTTINLPT